MSDYDLVDRFGWFIDTQSTKLTASRFEVTVEQVNKCLPLFNKIDNTTVKDLVNISYAKETREWYELRLTNIISKIDKLNRAVLFSTLCPNYKNDPTVDAISRSTGLLRFVCLSGEQRPLQTVTENVEFWVSKFNGWLKAMEKGDDQSKFHSRKMLRANRSPYNMEYIMKKHGNDIYLMKFDEEPVYLHLPLSFGDSGRSTWGKIIEKLIEKKIIPSTLEKLENKTTIYGNKLPVPAVEFDYAEVWRKKDGIEVSLLVSTHGKHLCAHVSLCRVPAADVTVWARNITYLCPCGTKNTNLCSSVSAVRVKNKIGHIYEDRSGPTFLEFKEELCRSKACEIRQWEEHSWYQEGEPEGVHIQESQNRQAYNIVHEGLEMMLKLVST